MENTVIQIQELLNRRAELQARLNLLPYDLLFKLSHKKSQPSDLSTFA